MAQIRAGDWGTEEYWRQRIDRYLKCQLNPREALRPRAAFVCANGKGVIGLVAGHLTSRFGCQGELQWISIRSQYRRRGIASKLLIQMARWFIAHHARRICVDVDPSNKAARQFYECHGAVDLKPHWMIWHDMERALDPGPKS